MRLLLFDWYFGLPNVQSFMLFHFCELWEACIESFDSRSRKYEVSVLILQLQMAQYVQGLSLHSLHQKVDIVRHSSNIIALPRVFTIVRIYSANISLLNKVVLTEFIRGQPWCGTALETSSRVAWASRWWQGALARANLFRFPGLWWSARLRTSVLHFHWCTGLSFPRVWRLDQQCIGHRQ